MEENNFKSVSVAKPRNPSFLKTIIIPFVSGIVGASLVIGVCFGVPSVKNDLFGRSK